MSADDKDEDKATVRELPQQQQTGKQPDRSALSRHLQKLRDQRKQSSADD